MKKLILLTMAGAMLASCTRSSSGTGSTSITTASTDTIPALNSTERSLLGKWVLLSETDTVYNSNNQLILTVTASGGVTQTYTTFTYPPFVVFKDSFYYSQTVRNTDTLFKKWKANSDNFLFTFGFATWFGCSTLIPSYVANGNIRSWYVSNDSLYQYTSPGQPIYIKSVTSSQLILRYQDVWQYNPYALPNSSTLIFQKM